MSRVQELCRRLKPVLDRRVDGLWLAYLADSDSAGRGGIEQTLELLAAKHLGSGFERDRRPEGLAGEAAHEVGERPPGERAARELVEHAAPDLDLVARQRDRGLVGRTAGNILVPLRAVVDLPVQAGDPLTAWRVCTPTEGKRPF